MDALVFALEKWEKMGNTINSYDDENNNYVMDFVNKDGEVEGWVKVYPGQGIRWNYPDSIMNIRKQLNNK